MSIVKKIPYVIKDNYLQLTLPGKGPFTLDSSHPTFERLKKALRTKNWKKIPSLVSVAAAIFDQTQGNVQLRGGVVLYKGKKVHSSLTQRIFDMIKEKKQVKHMLLFMDNLYSNPSEKAINSFFDWLQNNDLPITDDGCFLAYKSVDRDFKDTYSRTVDNSPGQIIMMSRKVADTDYDTQCSTGFHICSKQYGLYGTRVLAVKANPKYVLSAVDGKMRVTQYEVLMELGEKYASTFTQEGFSQLEKKLVVEVKKERNEIIKKLLTFPDIKRKLRNRKLSKKSLVKSSYARLKKMLQAYDKEIPKVGPEEKFPLKAARKAAGLTVGQIAKKMDVNYKTVANLENNEKPNSSSVENFLLAVGKLTGNNNISFPKPVAVVLP